MRHILLRVSQISSGVSHLAFPLTPIRIVQPVPPQSPESSKSKFAVARALYRMHIQNVSPSIKTLNVADGLFHLMIQVAGFPLPLPLSLPYFWKIPLDH